MDLKEPLGMYNTPRGSLVILKPDMRMDDEPCAEQSIHDGVETAGSERSDGQRDQSRRHGPVWSVSMLEDGSGSQLYLSKTQ